MFASCRTDDELHRPTAEMLRILRAAGCNTTDEDDLQMGMVAYNAALLACRHAGNRSVQPAWRSRAGRNESCPCGSGRKYKKCCLDKDRTPSSDNDHSLVVNFGPEILPRLWDDDAMVEDCAVLGRIMDRDRAFAKVGFSTERVHSFVDAVFKQETSLFRDADQDAETYGQGIDDLAVRYIRESGGRKVTHGIKDRLLAAIRRAQSKGEVRALATGICLALRADITEDPADDLLGIILFRRALFAAATPARIFNKIFDRLGIEEDELRRLIEANDPSINEKIESAVDGLDASELEALQAGFDMRHKNLWRTIAAGKFPVPMPFATQAALSGRLASASDTCAPEDLAATIIRFCNELIEDDYVIYGQMLDRWLRNSNERSDQIVDAVRMMRELCGIRSIKDLAPKFLSLCLRKGLAIPFDDEEQNFIDDDHSVGEKFEFIAKYSSWLETKGYPGMANRLLLSWETGDTSSERLPLRKSSFG